MKTQTHKIIIGLLLLIQYLAISTIAKTGPQHFVFFGRDRARINEPSFLQNENISGAQLKYTWKELEPEMDKYDLDAIQNDLEFLKKYKKKLFIQIQDVTFDNKYVNVPIYLRNEEHYGGGVAPQFITNSKDKIIRTDGYVPRRWDKRVSSRFHKLLGAIGKRFDGRIEGINLPETAVGFGETGKLYPTGFTPQKYRDSVISQMSELKKSFRRSVALQYANFMPGEWLPWDDKGYLESVFEHAYKSDIAVGGPDIKIYKKSQMNHSYKFLKKYRGRITSGVAVQWGNYQEINPKTGKQVTVAEIYSFCVNELDLDYIFWSTQEPFYSKSVLRFIKNVAKTSD